MEARERNQSGAYFFILLHIKINEHIYSSTFLPPSLSLKIPPLSYKRIEK